MVSDFRVIFRVQKLTLDHSQVAIFNCSSLRQSISLNLPWREETRSRRLLKLSELTYLILLLHALPLPSLKTYTNMPSSSRTTTHRRGSLILLKRGQNCTMNHSRVSLLMAPSGRIFSRHRMRVSTLRRLSSPLKTCSICWMTNRRRKCSIRLMHGNGGHGRIQRFCFDHLDYVWKKVKQCVCYLLFAQC